MIFLKLTKAAKDNLKRSGWLLAELLFVFIGMYGAFLLERMHEESLDDLRHKQILQALIDEFGDYEKELSDFSTWLDEGYADKFFLQYSMGEKPYPPIIPSGGMGNVNTGIWEAMLQSGGIELLEMEMILEIQEFFKKLQDVLDLYSRFERLTENLILPESDRNASFFYEEEGIALRNKYKWYVNSLFTIGTSLREMSTQAGETKKLLVSEFKKSFPKERLSTEVGSAEIEDETMSTIPATIAEEKSVDSDIPPIKEGDKDESISSLLRLLQMLEGCSIHIEDLTIQFDELYAIPFFSGYTGGEKPMPMILKLDHNLGTFYEEWGKFSSSEEIKNVDLDLVKDVGDFFDELNGLAHERVKLAKLSENVFANMSDANSSQFYDLNSTELKKDYEWFPLELFKIGNMNTGLLDSTILLREEVSKRIEIMKQEQEQADATAE
jgi:hypothetical protein